VVLLVDEVLMCKDSSIGTASRISGSGTSSSQPT
jgi:hypothetical protein